MLNLYFHLQGFDTPPHGVIDILKKLDWPQDTILYLVDPLNGSQIDSKIMSQNQQKNRFVIINTHEGASHHWFDRLIPDIVENGAVPMHQIVIRSSCLVDADSPVGHIGSVIDYVTDTVSEYPDITQVAPREITHHYVCLNNQHRWQRLELVKRLIDLGQIQHGKVSYLQAPRSSLEPEYLKFFPMTVDKKSITWTQGHDINLPALKGAALNVVTESCYEKKPGDEHLETHHLPGLTEKTFKSILLSQFPIFVAPMNTVQCYRDLGFDAFDDVIDHSYDLEPDPVKRLSVIAAQIEKFCQIGLPELQILFDQNRERFQRNIDRFRWFAHNHMADLPKWQKWLDDWKRAHWT